MKGIGMNRYVMTLSLALLIAATGVAHGAVKSDTINRMVLVESTYNPIVAGAIKRNFIPEESEPSMKEEAIVYANESAPVSRFERTPQHAGGVKPYSEKGLPGYVHLGIGSHNNLNGLAAYRWAIKDNHRLTFDARMDGWNCNIRRDDDTRWHSHLYDMGVGARYSLKMGKAELDAGISAERYTFNYFTGSAYDTDLGYSDAQRVGEVSMGVRLRGNMKEHYYYRVQSHYTSYKQQYLWGNANRNGEDYLHAEATLGIDLYERGMTSVTLRGDWMAYQGLASYRNYSSLGITPQWDYAYNDFDFVAGVNIDFMTRMGAAVQLSPNLKITYTTGESFSADMVIDGGRSLPTSAMLHDMSPYWVAETQLTPSYTFLNVRLSGNVRILEGLHLHVGGGYKVVDNALFQMVTDSAEVVYTGIVNHDAKVAFADARVSYTYKDLLSLSAESSFNHWMAGGDRAVVARAPKLDANVDARVRIIPGWYAHTGCRIVEFTGDGERAIINWSLGARYTMNDKLSFFLDGHNLLNRRYQHYAGYPSQGINVLAGAVFKF